MLGDRRTRHDGPGHSRRVPLSLQVCCLDQVDLGEDLRPLRDSTLCVRSTQSGDRLGSVDALVKHFFRPEPLYGQGRWDRSCVA